MRKAHAVIKGTLLIMPTQVGGAAALDVDDPVDAIAQLQALADEQRRRSPELTTAKAFAKVYSDPANACLVAAERRQARARLT